MNELIGTSLFLIDYSDKNKLTAYCKAKFDKASGILKSVGNYDYPEIDLSTNPYIQNHFKNYSKSYIFCDLRLYEQHLELSKGTEKLPVVVQKSSFSRPEEIIKALRTSGFNIDHPNYNTLVLTAPSANGQVQGLYLDIKNDLYLKDSGHKYGLKSSNTFLRKYNFDTRKQLRKYCYEVAAPKNANDRFFLTSEENLEIYSPNISNVPTKDVYGIVRSEILERLKDHTAKAGKYSQNLKLFKSFLNDLNEDDWTAQLAEQYHYDIQKVNDAYEDIFENAQNLATGNDEDMANLKYTIKNNESIRQVAINEIEDDWKKQNDSKTKQLEKLTKDISSLSTKKTELTKQIEELTAKKEKLESQQQLATDVEAKVHQRIEDARKNAADFIAEMAFNQAMMPKTNPVSHPHHLAISPFNPIKFNVDPQTAPIETTNAKDVYNALKNTLEPMINNHSLLGELTAYLYILHNQNRPLLLIGDDALDIAQLAALLLTGQPATQIECTGRFSAAILQELKNIKSPAIILNNLAGSSWLSHINSLVHLPNKWVILTESFMDDLNLAPRGLYNFATPIFTDIFGLQSSRVAITPAIDKSTRFDIFDYPHLDNLKGINQPMRKHIEEETAWITKALDKRDVYLPLFGYVYASGKKHLLNELLTKDDTPTAHYLMKFQELD
ncbi:hypothetical protein HF864_02020 [Lactobacillus sp. MRS-253-APC-2B]|uniref:hypothetical protein n=1 Tax=Lactobacillus sp. MRS-253-APC-2B TaxID=2725305 RepID=UPI00146A6CF1|nr:hypothetical protein [Lactobacillus sp. MRS-253-APC-2B]NME33567.1 hypothetical protein [Lactobacillus sp. MRS-253-APC-2B]